MAAPFDQTGSEGTEVSFTNIPNSVEAGDTVNFSFSVSVGDVDPGQTLSAEVKVFLYISGTVQQSIKESTVYDSQEGEAVLDSISHQFEKGDGRIEEPIWIRATVDYYGNGVDRNNIDESASTSAESIQVEETRETETEDFTGTTVESAPTTLSETFEDRTPFAIRQIEYDDDASYISSIYSDDGRTSAGFKISFEFTNPTLAIDTAGRFAKHEIIGGTTVRQKIGEDPINISINGVCKRRTANQIDSLRDAKDGKIFSDRLPGSNDALRVQFGSTSTEPMTDGGSADLEDGRYLYTFQINAIEVIR